MDNKTASISATKSPMAGRDGKSPLAPGSGMG